MTHIASRTHSLDLPHTASEFAGQHALVSGAAGGIGQALVRALLARGASVHALDVDLDALTALQHSLPDTAASRLQTLIVDVRDPTAVNDAVSTAETRMGPIDKLACVAGVLQMGRITELTLAEWAETFAVNATGPFLLCRAVAKRMMARRRGAIVNVSSNAATTPRAAMGAYAASKAALTQMTRCLALELAPYGIRCNIVSPGSTDTEMQRAMWRQGSSVEQVIQGSAPSFRLGIPLGKIASPEEVADGILFLLSERASHITLHDLRIDGGATLDQ